MKSKRILLLIGMVATLLVAGIALAHVENPSINSQESRIGSMMGNIMMDNSNIALMHEQMSEAMKSKTFAEFEYFREENGFEIMSWIDTEEEFKQVQEHHNKMGKYHGQKDKTIKNNMMKHKRKSSSRCTMNN
ncbi:hypothetical protein HOI26_02365 [Candidatus Woesearchaeota archaeon]|jgi:hypothetical protein|nr:hypothetical protein [Candidatus Woesearchaeota archaeon]MBT5739922.1 hypothetical protein [Candidatus Woesearchaeota archaeon]